MGGREEPATRQTGVVTRTSSRLARRVRSDFGDAAAVVVRLLDESPHAERVQAAAVIWAQGREDRFLDALALADLDWRDALMRTHGTAYDLAAEGWEGRLDAELGHGAPIVLWRPTGREELALVERSGWREWPPRLPDQPIFYPVLNRDYAHTIAQRWNVPASGVGYVTRFEVEAEFMSRYAVQQVGGRPILKYWIPAEDLAEVNANIIGRIQLIEEVRG